MDKQAAIALFEQLHPRFFEAEWMRGLPEGAAWEEMILALNDFDPQRYNKTMDAHVTFGFYRGDGDVLREAVAKVDASWPQYFKRTERVYCGYIDGKVASFCMVDDLGLVCVDGQKVKMGAPGCVGTLREYRDRGIGLTMVKHVTELLKDEGFAYSYIHYTGVAPWYAKLGYETILRWDKHGVL